MAGVGTAYVSVRVDTSKFEGDLDKMLSRLSTRMNKAGDQLGKDMIKGLKGADWDSAFKELDTAASKAATNVVKSVDRVDTRVNVMGRNMDRVTQNMTNNIDTVTDALGDTRAAAGDLSASLTDVGRAGGRINLGGIGGGGGGGSALRTAGDDAGFLRNALRALAADAERSRAILAGLFDTAAFGGSALGLLVGGLSGAAQGLFVVGANAAAMVPALSAATTGILGLAQAGITLKLAFSGVGDAITAGIEEATPGTAAYAAAAKKAAGLGDEMKKLVKPAKVSRDAIKAAKEAVLDSADAWQDAREGVQDAAQGIKDARADLARAYRDAAWSAEDAARSVQDAEEELAASQLQTAAAQEALNEVRAEALEQLEDIAFAAEDAALGEERASVALEEAYARLIEVSELSPDNKMRQEAELAFREAELNLRQAKDAREDADAAQAQAAATGIEGTEAYTSAQQDLVSAQEDQAAAAQALLDAQREQAQNAITDAEAVADAERGVIDAKRAHQDAIESLIEAHENYNDALQKVKDAQADYRQAVRDSAAAAAEANKAIKDHNLALAVAPEVMSAFEKAMLNMSPAQKEFIDRIIGMHDEFIEFRKQLAEPIFQALNTGLTKVIDGGLMDVLKEGLLGTSDALAEVIDNNTKGIDSFGELAESPAFKKSLGDVMESNKETIKNFGGAAVNLADAFVQVADAAAPLLEEFSKWVETVTDGWAETTKAKNKTGELGDTFQTAADRVKEFWGFAKELWRTLSILGDAANRAANQFGDMGRKGEDAKDKFGYITSLTDSLKGFNDKLADSDGKVQGFKQALRNLNSVGSAMKTLLIDPLIALGQDKDVQRAFDKLSSPAVKKSMETIAETAGDAAPKIADIAASLIEIVANIGESKAIEHFLDILGQVADILADVTGWAADTEIFGKSILGWTGYITGAYAAWRILKGALKIGISPFASMAESVLTLRDNFKLAKGEATGLKGVMKGIGGGVKGAFKSLLPGKSGKLTAPSDEAKAKQDGSDITEAFAKGIKSGMKFKDAAMQALRANVKLELDKSATAGARNAIKTGNAIMEGLETGITTGKTEAIIKATDAGRDVAKAVGKGAGTMSPSTITFKDGTDVMEGIELGIKAGTAEAVVAAKVAGAKVGHAVGGSATTAASTSTAGMGTAMSTSATTSMSKSTGKLAGGFTKMLTPLKAVARGFGGLMTLAMGPFGIAIELIILLLPVLIPLFKKLEEKTGIFSKTLEGLKWVLGKVWDAIKFVFDWVKDNWPLLLIILTGPIGLAVSQIIKHWDDIKAAVSKAIDFVKGVLTGMWDKITEGWDKIVKWADGLWESIKEKFHALVDKAKELLTGIWNGIKNAWWKLVEWSDIIEDWVGDKVQGLVDKAKEVLLKIWNGIKDGWAAIKEWAGGLWDDISGKIDQLIQDFKTGLGVIWDVIKDKWKDIKEWAGGLWNDIKDIIGDFVESFSDKIAGIWDGLKSGFYTAAKWVIDKINTYLIGGINKVLDFVGAGKIDEIPSDIPVPGQAEGGPVRGPGGPRDDKVLRRLSNGEYVLPTRSARKIGPKNLEYMRRYGELPPSTGGLFGSIWDKMKDVAGALANGAEYAIKWVLGNVVEKLPDNVIGDMIRGAVNWAADKFTGFFKKKDEEMAAAAGPGVPYTGPPGGWTYPVSRMVPISQWPNSGHSPPNSMDFDGVTGDAIRAASRGVVAAVNKWTTSYGNHVIVNHAGGVSTLYAHLSSVAVRPGQMVTTGQMLGMMGTTGNSTGVHLHFEVRGNGATDAWLRAHGVRLAQGGVVSASPGGTMALLAEAGQHERVTPLDREGFTPSERKIIELLESRLSGVGGSGGDTYNIQPSTPINEAALADMVSRRVSWNRRRGVRAS